MTTVTAGTGFRLRMDANGDIPELTSAWRIAGTLSASGRFAAQLIKGGPFFTTYTITAGDEIVADPAGRVSGAVHSLSLIATSRSGLGQNDVQLDVSDADVTVDQASRLPLSLFLVGDDAIAGSSLDDTIHGVTGNDVITGRRGKDFLFGDAGDDTLIGGSNDADRLLGGVGDDTFIISDARHSVIEAVGEGRDLVVANVSYTLDASSEVETLQAAATAKTINLTGSDTANTILGNDGKNVLFGQGGDDSIAGGAGKDTIEGGHGADQLFGGDGFDQVSYAHSADAVIVRLDEHYGYAGDALGDLIAEFEEVRGSRWSDQITGDTADNRLLGDGGDDLLVGGGGNDTLIGGRGDDSLVGGDGGDLLDYSKDEVRHGVTVDLTQGIAIDGFGGRDAVSNFEAVRGTQFKDVIIGSALNETLRGERGNDRLVGANGDDQLFGGAGNDTLTGGAGHDIFVFNSSPSSRTNVDRIIDFTPAEDRFYLDHRVLKNIGFISRPLKDDFFHLGHKAEDRLNRIIYDQDTGSLYYDPDGTGAKAQVKIAVLLNKVSLDFSAFVVI